MLRAWTHGLPRRVLRGRRGLLLRAGRRFPAVLCCRTDPHERNLRIIEAARSGDAGAYAGTFQLAVDIEASTGGQTWSGTNEAHVIMRDAGNAVVMDEVIPFETPVTGTRIGATIESVVLPVAAPEGGTPTP